MKNVFLHSILFFLQLSTMGFSVEEVLLPFQLENKSSEVLELLTKVEKARQATIGWCTKAKAEAIVTLILNTKPRICAEVGVYGGSSFLPMVMALDYMHSGRAYAIDSWSSTDSTKYMPDHDVNKAWWRTVNLPRANQKFIKLINEQHLEKICSILHEDSVAASWSFPDNSIEFLHWDGNHSFLGAQREFRAFLPKVKSGGYILISDVMWVVSGTSPIYTAMDNIFDSCELIDTIEDNNVFLFRKL